MSFVKTFCDLAPQFPASPCNVEISKAEPEPGTASGSRCASQRGSAQVDQISKEIPASHGTGSRTGSKVSKEVPSSKDPGSKEPSKDLPAGP